MTWRAGLIVGLLLAALVSGWSVWRHRVPTAAAVGAESRPEYVLHDFELVTLDKQGQESFTLRAPTMVRNTNQQDMQLATPVFLLPDHDDQYWRVSAQTGWIAADGNELRLRGDVRVASPPQQRKVAMNTEQLNVYPDSNLATSSTVVTITQPGSILSGRGLETNLASKHYELKSQVRTRYVP